MIRSPNFLTTHSHYRQTTTDDVRHITTIAEHWPANKQKNTVSVGCDSPDGGSCSNVLSRRARRPASNSSNRVTLSISSTICRYFSSWRESALRFMTSATWTQYTFSSRLYCIIRDCSVNHQETTSYLRRGKVHVDKGNAIYSLQALNTWAMHDNIAHHLFSMLPFLPQFTHVIILRKWIWIQNCKVANALRHYVYSSMTVVTITLNVLN